MLSTLFRAATRIPVRRYSRTVFPDVAETRNAQYKAMYGNTFRSEKQLVKTPEERWKEQDRIATAALENEHPNSPYAGRTVRVQRGDLAAAIKELDGILSKNNFVRHYRQTLRHEQRGYRLRRISSQHWRNVFATEVRHKIDLVQQIRRRSA